MEQIGAFLLELPGNVPPIWTDTLALSRFVTLRAHESVCDLGCGAGTVSLSLLARDPTVAVTAIDIDPDCVLAANANFSRNNLNITAKTMDWRDLRGAYSLAVCNPPYDGASPLVSLCASLPKFTRSRGRVCVCYPAERTNMLLSELNKNGFEPKRLKFVHHSADHGASIVLCEARFGGKPGLRVEPPEFLTHG